MSEITILAEVRIPLDRIVDAVGPEVSRALIAGTGTRLRARPTSEALRVSVDRVVSALDHLDLVTNSPGEGRAREALMNAVRGLRKAHVKNRRT